MAGLDNLDQSSMPDIFRRLRGLETHAALNGSSIGALGLRVHSGGMITIENGGLRVTGTAEIIGSLIATGTIQFDGAVNITGPLTIAGTTDITGDTTVTGELTTNGEMTTNGPLHVNGATDINGNLDVDGTLDINGDTTLNNDLTVQGGGKIKAGGLTVDPSLYGGSVTFTNGGQLSGTATGPQITGPNGTTFVYSNNTDAGLQSGSNSVRATNTEARITAGSRSVLVNGTGTYLLNLPTTTSAPNLYRDPSTGQLFRSTV